MCTPKIWLGKKINRLGGLKRYLEDTHHTFISTTNCDKLSDRRYVCKRRSCLKHISK
jgi:hypothetical protein